MRPGPADLTPITTARLTLESLAPRDAEALRALTDHPDITARIDFLRSPFTLADAEALIQRNRSPDERFLAIRLRGDGVLAGVIGAHARGSDEIEIGYWLGRSTQGRGHATEAVAGLVAQLRSLCPTRRIVAECDPNNAASWRVLIKAGFQPTGRAGHRPGRQKLTLAKP